MIDVKHESVESIGAGYILIGLVAASIYAPEYPFQVFGPKVVSVVHADYLRSDSTPPVGADSTFCGAKEVIAGDRIASSLRSPQ
jgi:hypothetical protein